MSISMLKKLTTVGLLFALTFAAAIYAAKVQNLYQVTMSVASQAESERVKAIQQGLGQVLVKLSGDPAIIENEHIETALDQAGDFVEQYTYLTPAETAPRFQIQIHFFQDAIDKLLKDAGVTAWGENRPSIALWLLDKTLPGASVITTDKQPAELLGIIHRQENLYGLLLVLPKMDRDDQVVVRVQDVQLMRMPVLKEAAKRYNADVLLAGTIEKYKQEFRSRWRLQMGDAQWSWTIDGKNKERIMTQLFDRLSLTLAKHYVTAAGEPASQSLKLIVSNVNKPDDVLHLLRYLKQSASLQQVEVTQMSHGKVELSAKVKNSIEAFQQQTAGDRRMFLKSQDGQEKLLYEWVQ